MDPKRFEELALNAFRWVDKCWQLKHAGDQIGTLVDLASPDISQAFRPMSESQLRSYQQSVVKWGALTSARALQYGLAIENACKARMVSDGIVTCHGDRLRGLRTDHDIRGMVLQLGVPEPVEHPEFLSLLTYQLQSLAKYPISKDLRKQNGFTGRAVGGMPRDGMLTEQIIVEVLHHEQLVQRFRESPVIG